VTKRGRSAVRWHTGSCNHSIHLTVSSENILVAIFAGLHRSGAVII
jgi:hypothetical protein